MTPRIPGLDDLTEVGRGGFGTVFAAQDRRFGRKVAVKIIRDENVGRNVVARFERECLALGSLSGHPNIVAVHDQGETEDGHLYLVMEFLGGGSFADRLAASGPMGAADTAAWGAALAGALETAHRSGIIHRDVKPENILFSDYGVPKLVDFGIARMRSAYQTRTGFVSATLMHAAPEIVAGGSISPSADVYSLASVLFTVLTGQAPFFRDGEETLAPLIARIATAQPPDLRGMGVPEELATVVARGLSKQPEERYRSAGDFAAALRDCARELGVPSAPVSLGDPAQVARAAETVTVGVPAGPAAPADEPPVAPPPVDAGPTSDVPRDRAVVPDAPEPEAPSRRRRRRVPLVAAAALGLVLAAGGAAALALRDDDGSGLDRATSTPSDSSSPEAPVALPAATIGADPRCVGLTCTFTASAAEPLPDGARWRWSVNGEPQRASGPRFEHTFARTGTGTVSLVAALGSESGKPARAKVRLGSWQPAVTLTPSTATDGSGALVTVRAPKHPECVPRTVQLRVLSGGDFRDQGDPVRIKDGTAVIDLERETTYRVLVEERAVRDGVCERARADITLPAATVVDPPTDTGPTDPDPGPTDPGPTGPDYVLPDKPR